MLGVKSLNVNGAGWGAEAQLYVKGEIWGGVLWEASSGAGEVGELLSRWRAGTPGFRLQED